MDIQVQQLQSIPTHIVDAVEKAHVDTQITTAKAYPRDITRVTNDAIAIVTLSKEVASTCTYAISRAGKQITGASVHLAKILAQQFGNIRAEAKVVEITDKQVVSRGTAWDLEKNYAVAFEVRRSIWGTHGRYSDDMITVTGNASNAIAYRNAVFAIIPQSITDVVRLAAQQKITGDLSDETKLIARRKKMIDYFFDTYKITEEELLKVVGKQTINAIGADQIALMIQIDQAIKDGDTTVEYLMKGIRIDNTQKLNAGNAKKTALKAKQKATSKKSTTTKPTLP